MRNMTEIVGVEPASRSLEEIVAACEIVQTELNFQIRRLDEHVRPRTETEKEYFVNMREGYDKAQYWTGILKRYHEGRILRQQDSVNVVQNTETTGPFIDED